MPENHSEKPVYPGLREEFRSFCESICERAPSAAWGIWHSFGYDVDGWHDRRFFPKDGTWSEKLSYLDEYLFNLLQPESKLNEEGGDLVWHTDLNKYRGWLLQSILREMHRPLGSIEEPRYILPEDIIFVVEDLYLFHKCIHGPAANIHQYKSLEEIGKLVEPYHKDYRISPEDRALAHAKHLEADTPRELAALRALLPPDFVIQDKQAFDGSGKELSSYRWGAKLITTLKNGTQIIKLRTFEASQAYGSPRWCTTRKQQNFELYNLHFDLLLVLAADGSRWQISLFWGQWRDANDRQVDLLKLCEMQPGLIKVLTPYIPHTFEALKLWRHGKAAAQLIEISQSVPEWNSIAQKHIKTGFMGWVVNSIREREGRFFLEMALRNPAIRGQITNYLPEALRRASYYWLQTTVDFILALAQHDEEWKAAITSRISKIYYNTWGGRELMKQAAAKVPEWGEAIEHERLRRKAVRAARAKERRGETLRSAATTYNLKL